MSAFSSTCSSSSELLCPPVAGINPTFGGYNERIINAFSESSRNYTINTRFVKLMVFHSFFPLLDSSILIHAQTELNETFLCNQIAWCTYILREVNCNGLLDTCTNRSHERGGK